MKNKAKNRGYTITETMISVAILSIVLGVIGLAANTSLKAYNDGIAGEAESNSAQTFFAYIMNDLRLDEYIDEDNGDVDTESDEDKNFTIQRQGVPTNKIIIKDRSWDNRDIEYELEEGIGIKRNGTYIIKETKDVTINSLDIQLYDQDLDKNIKGASGFETEALNELRVESSYKNYYIKPLLTLNENLYSRGYSYRYSSIIEEESEPIELVPCQIEQFEDMIFFEETEKLIDGVDIPKTKSKTEWELDKDTTYTYTESGVYEYYKVTFLEGSEIVIAPGVNVKIYTNEAVTIKEAKVNVDGDPGQLLWVNKGTEDFKLEQDAEFKGFVYTNGKVVLDHDKKGSHLLGAMRAKEFQISEISTIEYDGCGASNFTEEHIENMNKMW